MTDEDDKALKRGWVHHYADGFDGYANRGDQLYTFAFVSEATERRTVITVPKHAVDEFVDGYVQREQTEEN